MLARRDVAARKADDLVVAPDRRAFGDRARGDLVARRNQADDRDFLVHELRATDELLPRDDDVVGGVKADGQRCLREHGALLSISCTRRARDGEASIAAKSQSMPRPGVSGASAKPSRTPSATS